VIGSIADGNFDLQNFIDLGKLISDSVLPKSQETKANEFWDTFRKELKTQNGANLNEILVSKNLG